MGQSARPRANNQPAGRCGCAARPGRARRRTRGQPQWWKSMACVRPSWLLLAALAPHQVMRVSGKSERKTITQIAPVGNDFRYRATLRLVLDQVVNLIELVHRDELEDFGAHRAVGLARQRVD